MSNYTKQLSQLSIGLFVAATLVACGGGGSSEEKNAEDPLTGSSSDSSGGSDAGGSDAGGSDAEDPDTSGSDVDDPGTDGSASNCVNIKRPIVAQESITERTKFGLAARNLDEVIIEDLIDIPELVLPTSGGKKTKYVSSVTAISNTAISWNVVTTALSGAENKVTSTGIHTDTFSIADNYLDTSESQSTVTTTIKNAMSLRMIKPLDQDFVDNLIDFLGEGDPDTEKTVNTVSNYSSSSGHPNRREVTEVCIDDTWTTDYQVETNLWETDPLSSENSTRQVNEILTIESVDKTLTVPAGTFTAYQLKVENGTSVSTYWYDIASGALVKSVSKNGLDRVVQTEVLNKLTRPATGIDLSGFELEVPDLGDLINFSPVDTVGPVIPGGFDFQPDGPIYVEPGLAVPDGLDVDSLIPGT